MGKRNEKPLENDVETISTENSEMANVKAMHEEASGGKKGLSQSTRDILKCIIVLTVIAVFAGALLGAVNVITYTDPEMAKLTEIASEYALSASDVTKAENRIINSEGAKGYIASAYEVEKKSAAVYHAVGKGAYKGSVELLVFVENDIISAITVYKQSETQGIGSKVLDPSYLSRYIGVNLNLIDTFVKSGGGDTSGATKPAGAKNEIEFISGATKTSVGVFNAINAAVYAHKNYGG